MNDTNAKAACVYQLCLVSRVRHFDRNLLRPTRGMESEAILRLVEFWQLCRKFRQQWLQQLAATLVLMPWVASIVRESRQQVKPATEATVSMINVGLITSVGRHQLAHVIHGGPASAVPPAETSSSTNGGVGHVGLGVTHVSALSSRWETSIVWQCLTSSGFGNTGALHSCKILILNQYIHAVNGHCRFARSSVDLYSLLGIGLKSITFPFYISIVFIRKLS